MRYLLDTHSLIWLDSNPQRLSPQVTALCQDRDNTLVLSVVSVWEMQIKLQIGRLTLPTPLLQIVNVQRQINQIEILPVELLHVLELDHLPDHHRDPFDRLLIAQARVENLILISSDPVLSTYPVQVIW